MVRTEALPKHVSTFVDNRGKRRYRFRKTGCAGGYFDAHPNTQQGQAEYAAFLASGAGEAAERAPMKRRVASGLSSTLPRLAPDHG